MNLNLEFGASVIRGKDKWRIDDVKVTKLSDDGRTRYLGLVSGSQSRPGHLLLHVKDLVSNGGG